MSGYDFQAIREADLARIVAWLNEPHVARWWPCDHHIHIPRHLHEPWIEPFLIVHEQVPIGYLQCYDPNADPGSAWVGQPTGTRGVDLFIGEAGYIRRGHGSALLRAFCDALLQRPEVSRIIADPAPDNTVSIRAFAAAGFEASGERQMPWGRVLLMARDRQVL